MIIDGSLAISIFLSAARATWVLNAKNLRHIIYIVPAYALISSKSL